MNLSRRGLITGLISFVAAPAIVRAASLMPVKSLPKIAMDEYHEQVLIELLKQRMEAAYQQTRWQMTQSLYSDNRTEPWT